jgi:hypothetical protein
MVGERLVDVASTRAPGIFKVFVDAGEGGCGMNCGLVSISVEGIGDGETSIFFSVESFCLSDFNISAWKRADITIQHKMGLRGNIGE